MSAVADVLNGAADLILRDGWCQGDYVGPNGERCVEWALADAIGRQGEWWTSPLYVEACVALRPFIGMHSRAGWNDQPGRTKAEVVAALRAAAENTA